MVAEAEGCIPGLRIREHRRVSTQDQGCPKVCPHARTGGSWEVTQPTAFLEGSPAPRMFLSDTENSFLDRDLKCLQRQES